MEKWIVSYDIVKTKRRSKVAKLLQDYGIRVQYSVFECALDGLALAQLKEKLLPFLDLETDSVIFYRQCQGCENTSCVIGIPKILLDDVKRDYVMV